MNISITMCLVILSSLKKCSAVNVIDIDDILSKNFMPSSILLLENPEDGSKNINETFQRLPLVSDEQVGSFNEAMKTMHFHRSMMNQYLCRSFVASQILSEMTMPRIKRRMGNASPASQEKSSRFNLKNHLLEDEGSRTYKNWLSKSTTLEDIYRHYNKPESRNSDVDDTEEKEEKEKDEDMGEEYDGQVTDYVYQHDPGIKHTNKHREHGSLYYHHGGYYLPTSVHHGYTGDTGPGGYSDTGYSEPEEHANYGHTHAVQQDHDPVLYHSYPHKYHVHQHSHAASHGYDKENELADLFEVALTALAYLSFGMFLVHLIISISAVTNNATSTAASMMMPMSMSPIAPEDDGSSGTGGTDTNPDGSTDTDTVSPDDDGTASMGSDGTDDGGTDTMDDGTSSMDDGTSSMGTDDSGTDTMDDGTTSMDDGTTSMDDGTTSMDDGTASMDDGTVGGDMEGDYGTMMGEDGGSTSTGEGDMGAGGSDNGDTAGTDDGTAGTGDDGTDVDGTGDEMLDTFQFRLRRQVPELTNADNVALNELARRVLSSIEAALIANSDKGVCLRKTICENNSFSRDLNGHGKIFIPIWSLGMSWLSGKLVKDVFPTTSMLDSLKASILGLGKADCALVYQKCDLTLERSKRRRRRK